MTDTISILQEIANKITYTPAWITYIGVLVPIIVSIAVFIMQISQHKSNKNLQKQINAGQTELQKNIYNHQVELKCFDSILDIYKAFSSSVDTLSVDSKYIKDTISDEDFKYDWHTSLINTERQLYRKYDFASMLLGDTDLTKVLKNRADAYRNMVEMILAKESTDKAVTDIIDISQKYMDSMTYDNFDKYFTKYLNIRGFIET